VLAALLGTYENYVSVGEIRGVWRAVETDELCGCGLQFSQCPFWQEVGRRAFGGWDDVDHERLIALDTAFARHRHVLRALRASRSRRWRPSFEELTLALGRLYEAVTAAAGGATIVDSTKDPEYALLLRHVHAIDLRLVHLVRDSRGVAFSWSKRDVARPEYALHPSLSGTSMNTVSSRRAGGEWAAKNAMLHLLGLRTPTLRVRYEDLFPDARAELARIFRFDGRAQLAERTRAEPEPLEAFDALPLHTIGGNRVRFVHRRLELSRDEEWKRGMDARERAVVTAATWPLLKAYGYSVRT
jgi:hypothetical protein